MRRLVTDTLITAERNLVRLPRAPDLLLAFTVQPIMFVLLFVYVFGGAINTPGYDSYKDFLIPGIIVQTVTFNGITTGVGLAEDLGKGVIDRFRSLPMARSAVLAGRTAADMVRNVLTIALMLAVGFIVGFSFNAGVLEIVAGLAVMLLFGLAFSWIAALIGLSVPSAEVAQSAGFIWLFPLTFASSAFVPVATMPAVVQAFAEINPVTKTVDAVRHLFLGAPYSDAVWQSVLWSVALIAIFAPLATAKYRRTSSR